MLLKFGKNQIKVCYMEKKKHMGHIVSAVTPHRILPQLSISNQNLMAHK